MPLVKIFVHKALTKAVPLKALQTKMCAIWGVAPSTTKVILTRCEDWTFDSFHEDCYVDIRAMRKPERTREVLLEALQKVQESFSEVGLAANIRLEQYDAADYIHLAPVK
ncbi:hypothetical protein M885DRAFT_567506 [Pelagophyceae sp. CCMP2097]|nr:hypothetical protein M885DRAFT_567506 [Pelagophyceae sp. CCMP2097]